MLSKEEIFKYCQKCIHKSSTFYSFDSDRDFCMINDNKDLNEVEFCRIIEKGKINKKLKKCKTL